MAEKDEDQIYETEYKSELNIKFLAEWLKPDELKYFTDAFNLQSNDLNREIISSIAKLKASICIILTEYDPTDPILFQRILYLKLDKAFHDLRINPDDYSGPFTSSS